MKKKGQVLVESENSARRISCQPKLINRKAQVWVETVIYTLIALALIGATLAFVKPKLEEMKDNSLVEQSISMMKSIDATINNLGVPGNQRVINLVIKKGELKIDGKSNSLVFEMNIVGEYSEIGKEIEEGNLILETLEKQGSNVLQITRNYGSMYNITYAGWDNEKVIGESPTSYEISIKKIKTNQIIEVIEFEIA